MQTINNGSLGNCDVDELDELGFLKDARRARQTDLDACAGEFSVRREVRSTTYCVHTTSGGTANPVPWLCPRSHPRSAAAGALARADCASRLVAGGPLLPERPGTGERRILRSPDIDSIALPPTPSSRASSRQRRRCQRPGFRAQTACPTAAGTRQSRPRIALGSGALDTDVDRERALPCWPAHPAPSVPPSGFSPPLPSPAPPFSLAFSLLPPLRR